MTQSRYTLNLTACITYNDFSNHSLWKLPIPYKLGELPYYWPHGKLVIWSFRIEPSSSSHTFVFGASRLLPRSRGAQVWVQVYAQACGSRQMLSTLFLEAGSLTSSCTHWLDRLTASPRDYPPASTSQHWHFRHMLPCPPPAGKWGSNSCPYGILLATSLPGPSSVFLWDTAYAMLAFKCNNT